jgi:carbon monoxide dehydrogenase subunit G
VTLEDSIHVARSPEVVYSVVRDLERAPEWQESLESVNVEAGTEVRRFGGRRTEASFFVLEDDPPRRFAIRSDGGPAEARAEFDLEPDGDGTRVVFTVDLRLRGAARLAAGVVKASAQRELRADLERLKELVERDAGGRGPALQR